MQGVAYLGDGAVAVREYPRPDPGTGEALVELRSAGLCGSDLHKYHRSTEWAADRDGLIAGHEPAGVVAETGPGVDSVSVGDRVCVYHSIGCGHCEHCLAGTPNFCADEGAFGRTHDGAHADFMLTPERYCLPLPEDCSFAVGAQLACTAGTAYSALRTAAPEPRQPVAVFGLGPVGMAGLLLAEAMGFAAIGVEIEPYRIELARRVSDAAVIDAAACDPEAAVAELTDGDGAAGVLECSGSAPGRRQAAAVAARHGTVVYVGAGSDELAIDPAHLIRNELAIEGNAVYSMAEYFDLVGFIRSESVPLDDIVTHRFDIADAPAAFELFDGGETGKVVFEWD